MKKGFIILILVLLFVSNFLIAKALSIDQDSDNDGLIDVEETEIYHTNPLNPDTDNDGYTDGDEVTHNYDPNKGDVKIEKRILISLKDQSLSYFLGPYLIKTIKISSGVKRLPTPVGSFSIQVKKPYVNYKGVGYYYPNTRWNLQFKKGYYIHGAYWHNKFGQPMSHGCVNVSYSDMEALYNWADVGTEVEIK